MKTSKKILLNLPGLLVLLILIGWILNKSYFKTDSHRDTGLTCKDEEQWVDYFLDSTYKVVADTLIHIYELKTGEKISTLPMFYESIRSITMHPSGNYLAVLGEYYLEVYDLKIDNLSDIDTSTFREDDTARVLSDDITGLDIMDEDYIEFSADGKFLMVINYGDVEVMIYQWPGLKRLATGYMGFHRNNFWWENKEGKLVFFYYEDKYTYRTEFPSDPKDDSLSFSEPVCIDSVP